jgi:tetratricopeptide (TPR) repeat protein
MSEDNGAAAASERIGERYRVEAELGRGGMARVLRVCDQRSGERYALKQLLTDSPVLRVMFEREYYALVELAHPHIVRVCDYGLDARGLPYYTMELLDGTNARDLLRAGPLDMARACLVLRDCASALALIHSRRMVHRDLSPRNVWCMPNGRVKLIDFGTLIAMGAESRVAGTPPFIPPEALYGEALDARCDLFGLGALGYFLLADRHAFPARTLGELSDIWQRRPERLDLLRPELPGALSDLLMALLSLDPRARPASAAEVFEQLTQIASLPVEAEPHVAKAFLTSPTLIERETATRSFIDRLRRASIGRGNVVAIVAARGLGRTRMLASMALQAKLGGALTISVGATSVGTGPLAIASAIAGQLLELSPAVAKLARELGPVLAHLSPSIRSALGEPDLAPLAPHERTRKLNEAIVKLVQLASRDQTVVIAVDDLHRADSASLWVLGRLSLIALERRLLLVVSCDESVLNDAPPALAQLVTPSQRIALAPLRLQGTRQLLESIFNDVPGVEAAAQWLHELSAGNPQACMQYAQYLVDRGIARYAAGSWQLPAQLKGHGLPEDLETILEQRMSALSGDARTLALGLALARDQSRAVWQPETHLSIEHYQQLLDTTEPARAYAAATELQRAGVLQERHGYHSLASGELADVLLRSSERTLQERLHVRLAEIFAQSMSNASWLVVRHLLLGHVPEAALRAATALGELYGNRLPDWGAMRLSMQAEAGESALALCEQLGGAPLDAVLIRRPLLLICSVYDWHIARYGDAQIRQLQRDCGLSHWDELSEAEPSERARRCLERAQSDYDAAPAAQRGLAPNDALRELTGCALLLSGSAVNSHDVARAGGLEAIVQPFALISPAADLIAQLCQLGEARVTGIDTQERIVELGLNRLLVTKGLHEYVRQGALGVYAHIAAVEDARSGRERGLILIALIASAVGDEMFLVVHGRWLCHAFRGNATEAKRLYERVERITEDDVWRRRAFLFVEAELHALLGDLRSLRRVCPELDQLAEQFPGWRPWAHWAKAEALRLAGDVRGAHAGYARALALAPPGTHRAYIRIAPSFAESWLALGQPEAALREALQMVEHVDALKLDRRALYEAARIAALAYGAMGDYAQADAAITRATEHATKLELGGLRLVQLHAAKVRLALAQADSQRASVALAEMRRLLENADAPALANMYRILLEASRSGIEEQSNLLIVDEAAERLVTRHIETAFESLPKAPERAQRALEVLLEDSGCERGHLFLFDDGDRLFEAASIGAVLDDQLLSMATIHVTRHLGELTTVTETKLAAEQRDELQAPLEGHLPILLSAERGGVALIVGLALLGSSASERRTPRIAVVRAIGQALWTAGDSVGRELRD